MTFFVFLLVSCKEEGSQKEIVALQERDREAEAESKTSDLISGIEEQIMLFSSTGDVARLVRVVKEVDSITYSWAGDMDRKEVRLNRSLGYFKILSVVEYAIEPAFDHDPEFAFMGGALPSTERTLLPDSIDRALSASPMKESYERWVVEDFKRRAKEELERSKKKAEYATRQFHLRQLRDLLKNQIIGTLISLYQDDKAPCEELLNAAIIAGADLRLQNMIGRCFDLSSSDRSYVVDVEYQLDEFERTGSIQFFNKIFTRLLDLKEKDNFNRLFPVVRDYKLSVYLRLFNILNDGKDSGIVFHDFQPRIYPRNLVPMRFRINCDDLLMVFQVHYYTFLVSAYKDASEWPNLIRYGNFPPKEEFSTANRERARLYP